MANLGRIAPRDRERVSVFAVIARSGATKQSILSCCPMDCFAEPVIGRRFAPTRWLAMTAETFWRGCLKIESVVARGHDLRGLSAGWFGIGAALPRPVLHGVETSEARSWRVGACPGEATWRSRVRGSLREFDSLRVPLTRIASAMRSDLSPQAGRGEPRPAFPTPSRFKGVAPGPGRGS